jgi:hypothetical protein
LHPGSGTWSVSAYVSCSSGSVTTGTFTLGV